MDYNEIVKKGNEIHRVVQEHVLEKEFEELKQKYPDIEPESLPDKVWLAWGEKTLLEAYETNI